VVESVRDVDRLSAGRHRQPPGSDASVRVKKNSALERRTAMRRFPACVLALLLIGPSGISAAAQDAPPTFLLDPADIGVG
jgi:hypothetical protein